MEKLGWVVLVAGLSNDGAPTSAAHRFANEEAAHQAATFFGKFDGLRATYIEDCYNAE